MKAFILPIMCSLSIWIFGQEYEQMPNHIQKHMDDNKRSGLPIHSGIVSTYSLKISHATKAAIQQLKQQFKEDQRITHFEINPNGNHIKISATGKFSIKDIKSHIITTTATIDTYSVVFSID